MDAPAQRAWPRLHLTAEQFDPLAHALQPEPAPRVLQIVGAASFLTVGHQQRDSFLLEVELNRHLRTGSVFPGVRQCLLGGAVDGQSGLCTQGPSVPLDRQFGGFVGSQ